MIESIIVNLSLMDMAMFQLKVKTKTANHIYTIIFLLLMSHKTFRTLYVKNRMRIIPNANYKPINIIGEKKTP